MDDNKNNKNFTEKFLESLTPVTDGDLLHLSEGMGSEVGFNISLAEDGENYENKE